MITVSWQLQLESLDSHDPLLTLETWSTIRETRTPSAVIVTSIQSYQEGSRREYNNLTVIGMSVPGLNYRYALQQYTVG